MELSILDISRIGVKLNIFAFMILLFDSYLLFHCELMQLDLDVIDRGMFESTNTMSVR